MYRFQSYRFPFTGSPDEASATSGSPVFCYKTQSGECGEPLSQGDCGPGEWLVLGEFGTLECLERVCHPGQVLIDGKCLAIDDTSVCTGSGEIQNVI